MQGVEGVLNRSAGALHPIGQRHAAGDPGAAPPKIKGGAAQSALDTILYFCNYRNMELVRKSLAGGKSLAKTSVAAKNSPVKKSLPRKSMAKTSEEQVTKFADMFSAMGTEARLRIMQLLLSAHPEGMVVSEIQEELEIPNSTLSHHLDKLRNEGLVEVRRESTFLRYRANTEALGQLLQFLYAECCTRNQALKPEQVTQCCR
jgi:ArsR family transcriptional regulator, arsenate/arsenite/antimonite-responsive transcriptional repressor